MDELNITKEKARLKKQISSFFSRNEEWSLRLLNAFEQKGWRGVLFGGVPRGVHATDRYNPRDLDIVMSDKDFPSFADCFSSYIIRHTRFGGIHLEWADIEMDVWPLSSTWAFREKLVSPISFDGLVKTTFFKTDALAVEIVPQIRGGRIVYENGFFKAWESRILEINLEANPFPELCVVRGIRLADVYKFALSPHFVWYLIRVLDEISLNSLEEIQASHYGQIYYNKSFFIKFRELLEVHLAKTPLLAFSLFDLGLDDSSARRKRVNKNSFFYPF